MTRFTLEVMREHEPTCNTIRFCGEPCNCGATVVNLEETCATLTAQRDALTYVTSHDWDGDFGGARLATKEFVVRAKDLLVRAAR